MARVDVKVVLLGQQSVGEVEPSTSQQFRRLSLRQSAFIILIVCRRR